MHWDFRQIRTTSVLQFSACKADESDQSATILNQKWNEHKDYTPKTKKAQINVMNSYIIQIAIQVDWIVAWIESCHKRLLTIDLYSMSSAFYNFFCARSQMIKILYFSMLLSETVANAS